MIFDGELLFTIFSPEIHIACPWMPFCSEVDLNLEEINHVFRDK